jgi:hypothetical protein
MSAMFAEWVPSVTFRIPPEPVALFKVGVWTFAGSMSRKSKMSWGPANPATAHCRTAHQFRLSQFPVLMA